MHETVVHFRRQFRYRCEVRVLLIPFDQFGNQSPELWRPVWKLGCPHNTHGMPPLCPRFGVVDVLEDHSMESTDELL